MVPGRQLLVQAAIVTSDCDLRLDLELLVLALLAYARQVFSLASKHAFRLDLGVQWL